jgi:nitroreductase
MAEPVFVPLEGYREYAPDEMRLRSRQFAQDASRRRTVRDFSRRDVPRDVIEECIRAAGSAPSGANMQPWHFVAVSDPRIKRRIRLAAEKEEREFYSSRASQEWLEALSALGTDDQKPFLETAPWLIAIFAKRWSEREGGDRMRHYYVSESVGIATGILISALHHTGLATLTHTPSPMGFLNELLDRPESEKPFLLLVVGHPAAEARVPDIRRKSLREIVSFV